MQRPLVLRAPPRGGWYQLLRSEILLVVVDLIVVWWLLWSTCSVRHWLVLRWWGYRWIESWCSFLLLFRFDFSDSDLIGFGKHTLVIFLSQKKIQLTFNPIQVQVQVSGCSGEVQLKKRAGGKSYRYWYTLVQIMTNKWFTILHIAHKMNTNEY